MSTHLNQILFSLGVIVMLIDVASVNSDSQICQTINGKFLKTGTFCKGYYECSNWVPVEKICSKGYNFNRNSGSCDWKGLYSCPEIVPQREQYRCQLSYGEYPNIYRCSTYWYCLGGEALIEKCPPSELFDKIERKCVSEIDAVCADESDVVERSFNCPFVVGSYTYTRDCSKYYECNVYEPFLRTCKRGSLFEEQEKKCVQKERVYCGSRFNPYVLKTTEKVTSTAIFSPTTPSDDPNKKTTILEKHPPTSTNKPSTAGFTYSTFDPDSQKTNFKDMETSTSLFVEFTATEMSSRIPFTNESTPSKLPTSSVHSTTNIDLERTTSEDLVTSTKMIPDSTAVKIQSTSRITTENTTPFPTSPHFISTKQVSSTESIVQETTISKISSIPTEETEIPTAQTATNIKTSTKRITGRDTTLREKTTFTPEIVEVTTSIEQNVVCPKPYGQFSHPTDVHKFIVCVNNVPSIFDCPANLVYNEKRKRCDYK